ncbi:MAG: ribbon-helix-helix domain-containing protein [Puniceicoccales bacterium]|jgi:hypothetical protein|nr:ribbon-helix-helix domain-containing protein [Puniceicoccales bacterium]
MESPRSKGQSFIGVPLDSELLGLLDEAREAAGENRAEFVRLAIVERLVKTGYRVNARLAKAPDRRGKGGPRKIEKVVSAPTVHGGTFNGPVVFGRAGDISQKTKKTKSR